MRKLIPTLLLLIAAALQLYGTVSVIIIEGANMNRMTTELGVGPGPCTACFILLASTAFLLLGVILSAFRNKLMKILSLSLLVLTLLCNAWIYVMALMSRTGHEYEDISLGRMVEYAFTWVQLTYWEWWFFSSSLFLLAAVLWRIYNLIKKTSLR